MYSANKEIIRRNSSMVYRFDTKVSDINMIAFGNEFRSRYEKLMITAFISPKELSNEDEIHLKAKNDDPVYFEGLKSGWSILTTGELEYNLVIMPGKRSRKELVDGIPDFFWDQYKDIKFVFFDGTKCRDDSEA